MKRIIIICILAIIGISMKAQPTWTSINSGDWQNPAIWSTSGGAYGTPPPTLSSNMKVIVSGHSVTQYSSYIQLNNDARLEIINGGRLRVVNNVLIQSGGNTLFKIDNGSFEVSSSSYSAHYIRLENGTIEWSDAIVRSGGYLYSGNIRASLNNVCVSSASWMHWSGIGTSSNFSTMNNVGLYAATHVSDQLMISSSFLNLNNLKLFIGNPGNLSFNNSTLTGSIYSIYLANGQINSNSLLGTPQLSYWCAGGTPNLSVFSGSRIQNCGIAISQPCGPQQPPCDVSVTKIASNQNPGAGQQMNFLLKVANNSPFVARSIRVHDLVPAGYELQNFSPQVGSWNNPYWIIGDLNSYAEVQAFVYVRVKSSGDYTNTASLSPTGSYYTDLVTANNQSSVTPNVQATSDLQITKVVDNQYPQVNQNITYTIQVKNNGPGVPANITVTDFLPSGLQYYSHTVNMGGFSPSTWSITGFQLNPGQTATLSLVARVLPNGNYVNSATVQSELTDPNTANNTASVEIFPLKADLELSITADNMQPLTGSNVTLTLQVKNNGPSNASQVQVSYPFPSGLQYVSATPAQGTAGSSSWNVGTLNQGATTTLNLVAKVMPTGNYTFQSFANAPLHDPNTANNQASLTLQPIQNCDLKIQKTVSNATPIYGSHVSFNINVWNQSISNATGVIVTDVLPTGYTFVNAQTNFGTWSDSQWNIGIMPGGSSASMQIIAIVNTTGDYTNTATISGNQPDPDPSNNTSSASVSPILTSDLSLFISPSNPNPTVGEEITYTIIARNFGPNPATGTLANFNWPLSVFVSANASNGTYSDGQWLIGDMFSSNSDTLTVVLRPQMPGMFAIQGNISCTNGDHHLLNNNPVVHLIVQNAIDLLITKQVSNPTPNVGSNINFQILIGNTGNLEATNVVVVEDIPDGYELVSFNVTDGTWSAPNWTIPLLPPGQARTMVLTVKVLPSGHYINTVTASASQTDPNPGNNIAVAEVFPIPLNGPTANNDIATGIKNQPLDINVLTNDLPGDSPINPASVEIVEGTTPNPSTQGSLSVDPATGLITFLPAQNFTGTVITQYSIRDMNNIPAQAQLTINIIEPLTNYYPANGPGTLAFEDLWPGKGDYDFNDLVVDYRFELISDFSNHMVIAKATFTIRAFGASLENGFGFQLPASVNHSNISVSGSLLTEGFIQLNASGLEEGQDKPTIIVFDNAFAQMQHPGIGTGVNTDPDAPYVDPVTIQIEIQFVPGTTSINDLNIAAFNPFLIVNKVRGHEIHLPNYLPTSKADLSLFGKWEDASRPQQGKFYVTVNNLPWAINLYESFDYPIEKRDITHAYHKFVPWVVSSGVQFPDWYKNLTGYRNNSLIYQVPTK
ncbi:MAG: LruC domain-containing protein [Bacteroidales bacterium]|nr:LruC domain-containing protein [Bacteroidales bacterium]